RAGLSVGAAGEDDVRGLRDVVDHLRRPRGAGLAPRAHAGRARLPGEQLGHAVQQHVRVRLGVVEDTDGETGEARLARREPSDLSLTAAGERAPDFHGAGVYRRSNAAATPASATAIAAVRNASPNAAASPTVSRRAANKPASTSTPVTTPSVRARNAKPPATPCCAAENAPMISAMFGTWKRPRPKPAAKRAMAMMAGLVAASARLSRNRPSASSTSPATIGPRPPRRSAARPAI